MGDSSMHTIMFGGVRANEVNFGFAYNDSDFSDRIIRLETLNSNSGGVRVTTLHISSPILAAKSPFFYKLFKNGMRETLHRNEVTLRIDASEEAALMDLLKFMYDDTLSAISAPDLLDVLMLADQYEVNACMRYCIELLLKLPMSLESALFYIELPSIVLLGEAVEPLIDSAKQYLATRYRDLEKSRAEATTLPLSAIEVVLGSDGLRVNTEDVVFDFILKWARSHYPKLDQRREILTNRLARFICFPYMSCKKLKGVLNCPEFDREEASKIVFEALKASKGLATTTTTTTTTSGRFYNYRPIKVVQFEFAQPRCVVYYDLYKQECTDLLPSEGLCSEAFPLGGKWFYLVSRWTQEQQSSFRHFGLSVHTIADSKACSFDFEIAVMKKPSKEFEPVVKGKNCAFTGEGNGKRNGKRNIFSWTDFSQDDNEYFIDGILHIRADLTINNDPFTK